MLNTTKTPNSSTEYSNSAIELRTLANHTKQVPDLSATHTLKNESTYQLGRIPVIFNLCVSLTKINGALIQSCKTQSLYDIHGLNVVQNHSLHRPKNMLKNGLFGIFYFVYTFCLLLIKELILMNCSFVSWIEKNCSSQGKRQLVELYFKETEPSIKKATLPALTDLFFYYSTGDEFITSIEEVGRIIGYQKTQTGEFLQEIQTLNFIRKERKYFDKNKSLVIQLINIEPLFSFLREKPLQFLATYLKTETLHARGMAFKVATFKNVHDVDNIITIKTDRISYDDETSDFLKKLNAGDIINYTPSVNKPTIKGIKHPLNLKIHTKAETEEDMTFFATFDCIEEKIVNGHGLRREARFSNIHNINGNIHQKHTWTDIKPNTPNTLAIAKMDEGREVVFKASIIPGDKGFYFKNIHNIMPRDEYHNNYGACND